MGPQLGGVVVVVERWTARQEGEGDARQGVDVGAAVDILPADLLWRDVVQRAEEVADRGHPGGGRGALGEPEVGEVDVAVPVLPVVGEHDVARLDVSMDEARVVGGVECAGGVAAGPAAPRAECERAPGLQLGPQVGAADVLASRCTGAPCHSPAP